MNKLKHILSPQECKEAIKIDTPVKISNEYLGSNEIHVSVDKILAEGILGPCIIKTENIPCKDLAVKTINHVPIDKEYM